MFITDLAIKKTLTVFVFILLIVFVGSFSYITLPRESAPDITIPYIIVQTLYFGVSPTDMETLITNPIEQKLRGLEDVKQMTSTSADSVSTVVIEFNSGSDIDEALDKVREKVDLIKSDLPDDAEDPQVIELNISNFPIMVVNISGDYGRVRLKAIAEELQEKIESVKGVLSADISGGLEREIHVIADSDKLLKYGLSLSDISGAIQAENINIPGGTMDIGSTQYQIRVPGEFKKIKNLENIVIDSPSGTPIYLRDVAAVHDTFKEDTTYSRLNHRDSVSLSIQKRSGENLIAIADEIKRIVDESLPGFPPSTEITYVADQSVAINDMVNNLENSIILGLVLVILVLNIFMGKRNAFFVAVAIPLSMLISFSVLQLMDITLNMVVLFSLILALGMLVDNAIVIVENIYRHLEEGYSRKEAASVATHEVAWPVIASTATTIAAFAPIIFMPGISGQFMKFLPIVVITTILASLFVALVINPVICATYMKLPKVRKSTEQAHTDTQMVAFYRSILNKSLHHRKTTVALAVGAFFGSIFIYGLVSPGFEFFPNVTPEEIYIDVAAPEGSTIDYTNDIVSTIEKDLIGHTNIARVIAHVGSSGSFFSGSRTNPSQARIIVEFNEEDERTEHPNKTIKWIRERISRLSGADIKVEMEDMGPPTGAPIGVKIAGKDFAVLADISHRVKSIMSSMGGIVDIKDDYVKGRPEVIVDVDRDKAQLLGVNTLMISSTIRTAIQGSEVSVYREGNDEYDIILKLDKQRRQSIGDIESLIITGRENRQVPLLKVANVRIAGGVGSINHHDMDRVITIEANPAEGFLANERLSSLSEELKQIQLPAGYSVNFVGESEEMEVMGNYLLKAFIIAILLISAILITQFNSLILPAIIVCSVFFSLIGIFLGLAIFRQPFGVVMTGIGVISLAGVVVNNAIVLIDYIGILRERGSNKYDAVIEAGTVRLRPVLLTAVTTILGLVPMTFGINFDFKEFFGNLFGVNPISNFVHAVEIGGQSSEFWSSMGSAVTIGLATGTVLTLVLVPTLYIMFDNIRENLGLS